MAELSVANVREYLQATNSTGQWADGLIGSNIRASIEFLQRRTGRQFQPQSSNTKTFSTNGAAFVTIPDLRVAHSVTLAGSALVADETFHLHLDNQQSGVYVGMQFRSFGGRGGYRSFPDWFDTNKDAWWWPSRAYTPNDLVIVGDWGHDPYPEAVLHAWKVLAAFYTIRPDALLSGARQTPEGNVFDLSRLPLEVQEFISGWKLSEMVVLI